MKSVIDYVSKLILSIAACSSLAYSVSRSMGFGVTAGSVIVITSIIIILFALMFYNKLASTISFISLISAVIIFSLTMLVSRKLLNRLVTTILKFYLWVEDCFFYEAAQNRLYELIFVILACLLIAIPIFIFTVKKYNFYAVLIGGMTYFILSWTYDYLVGYNPFYVFIALIIVYYLNHIYIKNAKKTAENDIQYGFFLLWTFPLALVILVGTLAIPPKEKPFEWSWLDAKVNSAYDFFDNIYNSYKSLDYFSIESSGFGYSRGKLGGKANLNDNLVLTVTAPRYTYLKGSSQDTYTGNAWSNSENNRVQLSSVLSGTPFKLSQNDKNENEIINDTVEATLGPYYIAREFDSIEEFANLDKITIKYENIRTKSLFIPYKISSFDEKLANDMYMTSSGLVISDKSLKKGLTYTVGALNLKTTDENFINLLRRSRKGIYTSRPSVVYSAEQSRSLQLRANYNYSRYMQLPPELPKRVTDLAKSLTEKATNNYDKVKAIEQHLANRYPYTLNPKPKPREQDFVDFFLFDGKEGYCTYYATAMTVMVRSIGIPARYVEGYMLPSEKDPETGNYLVTNKQAHSWVEVYFEGFGWVPFEPTAPFTSVFYQKENSEASFTEEFLKDPAIQDYRDELESLIGEEIGTGTTAQENPRLVYYMLIAFISALLLFLLILCITNYIRSRAVVFKAMKMEPRQSILYLYSFYLRMLSAQQLTIAPGETPGKYAERVDRNVYFQPVNFKNLTSVFIKARYSKAEIKEEEKQLFCDFYRAVLERAVYNMGKFKYFAFMFLRFKHI